MAIECLRDFAEPGLRDRILNLHRPLPERDAGPARDALQPELAALIVDPAAEVASVAVEATRRFGTAAHDEALEQLWRERTRPVALRGAALTALAERSPAAARGPLRAALGEDAPELRRTARELLVDLDPAGARAVLESGLRAQSWVERQGVLEVLGRRPELADEGWVLSLLDARARGSLPGELELELHELATQLDAPAVRQRLVAWESETHQQSLGAYLLLREGGSAERGRTIFRERAEAQCLRCHSLGEEGAGVAGPDLTGIGGRRSRDELIESLVLPNARIAEGYHNENLFFRDGAVVSGRILKETETEIHLHRVEEGDLVVAKSEVEERRQGLSSMPTNLTEILTPRELRDLVAFLASLEEPAAPAAAGKEER